MNGSARLRADPSRESLMAWVATAGLGVAPDFLENALSALLKARELSPAMEKAVAVAKPRADPEAKRREGPEIDRGRSGRYGREAVA
jgi:hypothetical protein